MKLITLFALSLFLAFAVGCSSTALDKAATEQNDTNVQAITKQNEDATAIQVKEGKLDPLTAQARHEENESAKKLARKMARRAGNDHLPDLGGEPTK